MKKVNLVVLSLLSATLLMTSSYASVKEEEYECPTFEKKLVNRFDLPFKVCGDLLFCVFDEPEDRQSSLIFLHAQTLEEVKRIDAEKCHTFFDKDIIMAHNNIFIKSQHKDNSKGYLNFFDFTSGKRKAKPILISETREALDRSTIKLVGTSLIIERFLTPPPIKGIGFPVNLTLLSIDVSKLLYPGY